MWSQTLVIHMLRSPRLPSLRDHAAPALCALTVLGLALVTWLPASPIADALGLTTLPTSFFALLVGIVTAYIALTQLAKRRRAAVACKRKTPCQLTPPLPTPTVYPLSSCGEIVPV